MWRYGLAIAAVTGMLSLLASAQTPAKGKDADKAAARAAQGYAPVTLWEHPDVRAIRVELKPMANRAIHQHDDVKFHLFIPVTGTLQITIGSDKPVDAPAGQAFYIKGGTPHGFRNLGSTPGTAIEIFVKNGASTASLDAVGALAGIVNLGSELKHWSHEEGPVSLLRSSFPSRNHQLCRLGLPSFLPELPRCRGSSRRTRNHRLV